MPKGRKGKKEGGKNSQDEGKGDLKSAPKKNTQDKKASKKQADKVRCKIYIYHDMILLSISIINAYLMWSYMYMC